MNFRKILFSQSGQSMITAMLLGFGMAGVSGLVLWESQQAEKNLRIPRIRSAMSGVEAKVRMAATKPQTYNCTTDSTTTVGATCTLTIVNTDFQENFTGAKCSGSGACGISVDPFTFVPATATTPAKVQTKISYQGQELSIKPIDVDIEVPLDLMQKSSVNCITLTAGAQPIFMGYRPDGSVICQALPGGCGAGEFVSAIDPTTLKLTCGKFPNSGSCGANEYMTKFDPMSNTPVCTARANAFTKFGGNTTFSSTRGQVSNPARPGADSCVLITTTLPPTTSPPPTVSTAVACGSAHGGIFPSYPTSGLCQNSDSTLRPDLIDSVASDGTFNWGCSSADGTIVLNCSATKGAATTSTTSVTPTTVATGGCTIRWANNDTTNWAGPCSVTGNYCWPNGQGVDQTLTKVNSAPGYTGSLTYRVYDSVNGPLIEMERYIISATCTPDSTTTLPPTTTTTTLIDTSVCPKTLCNGNQAAYDICMQKKENDCGSTPYTCLMPYVYTQPTNINTSNQTWTCNCASCSVAPTTTATTTTLFVVNATNCANAGFTNTLTSNSCGATCGVRGPCDYLIDSSWPNGCVKTHHRECRN